MIINREYFMYHLHELQADLEDMSDLDLLDSRQYMKLRVETLLEELNETDEDNI